MSAAMKLWELTRERRLMLKEDLLAAKGAERATGDEADALVTDEELERRFGDADFTDDNFPF